MITGSRQRSCPPHVSLLEVRPVFVGGFVMRRSPVCVLMFSTQLLKGRWYYSASVFALWTLSSPELTLHQISDIRPWESAVLSQSPARTFNAFLLLYVPDHFSVATGRNEGTKTENDNVQKKKKNRRTVFEPGHKPSQFRPSGDVLLFAQNSASQKESYHRS